MDTDTTSIEKGVTGFEVKYNTLKAQYRELELSCDKDLSNFQLELKSVSEGTSGGVDQAQQLDKIAELEKKLMDTTARLLECCNGCKGPPIKCAGNCGLNSSSLGFNSRPGSSMARSALDISNPEEGTDYETDYSYGGHANSSQLLAITEATTTLDTCVKHMDDTIEALRANTKLTKAQKPEKYFETCMHDIQLTHEVMHGRLGTEDYIAFPVPKSQMRMKGGNTKQKCACCGREEGGWDALHSRGDPTTGSRTCPFKGTNCSNCKRYGLLTLDNNENYINHTAEACPLNNMPFFKDRLVSYLADKHGPDLRARSQLSAFDE